MTDLLTLTPTGVEGGIDTNTRTWIEVPQAPGLVFKPLRASGETGIFSSLVRLESKTSLGPLVAMGAVDLTVLSGQCTIAGGSMDTTVSTGTYGYIPANTRLDGITADLDTEILVNCFGPIAFLADVGIASVLTSHDLARAARDHGVWLVPNTLVECMTARPDEAVQFAQPSAIADPEVSARLIGSPESTTGSQAHPHFIDTRALEFFVNPEDPDIGLKVLRVSPETGVVSLHVRHNGVAGPHYHLGPADFLVLSGHIGYRAGPSEGYGPGVWFFEPAGARHEATHRIGDEDLIYTANVYGPIQFDSGVGTPVAAVASWMVYQAVAEAAGFPLVANVFEDDSSLLAWSPL